MVIYGLYGFTHGWGRLLTVMSPAGAAALEQIVTGDHIEVSAGDGKLTQYHEKRQGALARMVRLYNGVRIDPTRFSGNLECEYC